MDSKRSRYLEAFKEGGNLIGLTSLVAASAALLSPLPLLAGLVVEAAYLLFVPDSHWYDARLSRRSDAEVEQRRQQLKAQTFTLLDADMQARFTRLEEIRSQINAQAQDDRKWFLTVLRKLDYLLEKFLLFAGKEAEFRRYIGSVWHDECGSRQRGAGRGLNKDEAPPASRAAPMVTEVQASYKRDIEQAQALQAKETDANTIGIDKWMRANRPTVEAMIQAIAQGGQTVKTDPAALHKAAQISAEVYHDAGSDASYWERYYRGTQEKDATGVSVDLGGSSANNLADTLVAFGLVPGSADLVSATYTVFGNLVSSQYHELLPSVAPASEVVDKSYLQDASKQFAPTPAAIAQAKPTYAKKTARNLVGHRSWDIHFNPGKATFTPDAQKLLNQLAGDLLVASGTVVEVHGYTDSQGSHATSLPLSQARAAAVAHFMQAKAPVNFPGGRIKVFAHGEANPVASNATAEGRQKNRRVEIVLRSAG